MPYQIDADTLPPLVREFAAYKATIQNCSPKTVEEYESDLRTFFRYIRASREKLPMDEESVASIDITGVDLELIRSVKTEEIYAFFMFLTHDRENQWSAKARKLSAIKAFYKYLTVKRNLLTVNPAIDIEAPKRKNTLPKFLSLTESTDLLDAIVNDGQSKTRERDFAIITLFLNCGMRLSELVGIDIKDLDRDMRSLRVLGKGAKERMIYLNDACRDALTGYLRVRTGEKYRECKTDALFLSSRGQRISNKTVQWLVNKYLDAAGLGNKHYSTHKLRHTAATLMYQTGNVDVRVLKEILGHEQLNTTQIYTHVSNAGMEKAMEANPLSGVKMKNIRRGVSDDSDGEEK